MITNYFWWLWFFTSINRIGATFLSFIYYLFYPLTICSNFSFLLIHIGKILIPYPSSQLFVRYYGWDTISATNAYPTSNILSQYHSICHPLISGILKMIHCLEPNIAVPPGLWHHCKFLIPSSSTLFPTPAYLVFFLVNFFALFFPSYH